MRRLEQAVADGTRKGHVGLGDKRDGAHCLAAHAEARRVAENALGEITSSRDMYKRRLEASEREAFALEKALEEKTRGVETAMAIARRQIAYQEERYEALVKEYEALKARAGET